MSDRYVVIGGVAAGMSAASRIRKVDPKAEVIVLEKGDHISYSACSMPYYIARPESDVSELVVLSVADAKEKRGIDVRTHHEVTAIHPAQRTVSAVQHPSGREHAFRYDRLVIATGAAPRSMDYPGEELPHVVVLRNLDQGIDIKRRIDSGVKKAVLLGGGYIGLEMCESLRARGADVTLITHRSAPMAHLNSDIVKTIIETLDRNGVTRISGIPVERITETGVRLADRHVDAGLVLIGKGVRPNAAIAESAGIRLGAEGAIGVDSRMETSISGIFAAGDCAESLDRITDKKTFVPLGTVANKHGRVAGLNAAKETARFPGVINSAQLKLFEMELGHTGLTAEAAEDAGFDPVEIHITSSSGAHGYPDRYPIQVCMVGDRKSRRILGAQLIGQKGVAHRVNVLATAIFNGNTVDEFSMFDLAYAPPFAPVWDPVLVAAQVLEKKMGR